MTRLALVTDRTRIPTDVDEVFVWDGAADQSFKTKLTPTLSQLGTVPPLSADVVRIALAVYAADHSVKREGGGSNWNRRELDVIVPVSDPELWARHSAELIVVTNFLTGDDWSFQFTYYEGEEDQQPLVAHAPARVVLASGGADSGTGAVISASSLAIGSSHILVSHSSSGATSGSQQEVHDALEVLFSGKQEAHHRVFLARAKKRLDGTEYSDEPSSRSRSFLFLALGLAVAAQSGATLWIPENGFASLNPPLGPERLGALSTKTTHPWFLWRFQELLMKVGAHAALENPFQLDTKGEMFAQVASLLGADEASMFLTSTNSCSHTDQNYQGVPSGTHCGVCFGCIVRRASFTTSGVKDATRYLSEDHQFDAYTASHSVVEAARDFVDRGIDNATIMAMPLPPGLTAREAKHLCERGRAELGAYLS
ncbi:hypothetical protein J7E25_03070 [Agromyces sp. ISL-38]|uniref:hypothetical protein n=1 Tax=Agromyces sp. ISL-38 TaxID=2819107 RepID=UPI001BE96274|nr:hypothetical protein [Agromyces sp. ISL-38]MBT2498069.1 hypothetical protein [Agromyces sp. ISL-38]